MITTKRLHELARLASKDSKDHGYEDHLKPVYRTLYKAAVEVAEAVNAYRDNKFVGALTYNDSKKIISKNLSADTRNAIFKKTYEDLAKDTVQDELADVAIYLLVAAGNLEADFSEMERVPRHALSYGMKNEDFVCLAGYLMSELTDPRHEDIQYTIFSLLNYLDVWFEEVLNQSLEYWICEKMEYNKLRPYRHGRKDDPTL